MFDRCYAGNLFTMIAVILVSLLAGVILTLVVQCFWIRSWFSSIPEEPIPKKPQFGKFLFPQDLLKSCGDGNGKYEKESCRFLNLIFQFLFKELRDTREVRRWVAKRMSMEFDDMLQTTSGKLLEQIMVRDFNLGTRFPTFNSVVVKNEIKDASLEVLEIALDIEYSGGFQMAVDVDLMFGKSAYLSITVTKLVGCARLLFTRHPYTHWNFAFYEEPHMEFEVEPRIEGKSFPQITSFIINQIKRVVKKKHTLPNYKIRFRPFFFKPESRHPLGDIYLHGTPLGVGWLEVNIIGCTRLAKIPPNVSLFCTLCLGSAEMEGMHMIRKKTWVIVDVEIVKGHNQPIGLVFKEGNKTDCDEETVVIESVVPDSPAGQVDVRKNDILQLVGSTKITSVKQAVKLTKNAAERITLRLRRPHHRTSQPNETKFDDEAPEKIDEPLDSDGYLTDNKTWDEIESDIRLTPERGQKKEAHGLSCPEFTHRRPSKNSLEKVDIQAQSSDKIEPRRLEVRNLDTSRCESKSPSVSPKRQPALKTCQLTTQTDHPAMTRKSSRGEEEQFEFESLLDLDEVDDSTEMFRTRLVMASPNPVWNEQCEFEVEEDVKYLNVYLWCREPEKIDKHERVVKPVKDVLIGHVSFLLSEIALDCVTTMQGDTQKTKPLIPSEPKPGASRNRYSTLSTHPGFEPMLCHGDITLSFMYQATEKPSEQCRKRLSKNILQPSVDEPVVKDPIDKHEAKSVPNTTRTHKFVVNCPPYQSASYCCSFCARKIWMGRGFKCNVCGMIVHKKCTEKCQEKTLCTREGPRNRTIPEEPWKPMTAQQMENQKSKIQDDKETPTRSGGLLSKFRKDPVPAVKKTLGRNSGTSPPPDRKSLASTPNHSPKTRRKKSLPETQSSGDTFEDSSKLHATTAGLPRTRSSTSLQVLLNQNASPTLQPHEVIVKPEDRTVEHSDDSDSGTQGLTSKAKVRMNVSNFDEEIVTNAKEKGKELLSHLSLEERREKLDTMKISPNNSLLPMDKYDENSSSPYSEVSMLQEQIDQATEAKSQLTKKEKEVSDAATKKICQNHIRMTDEEIEKLMIQLLHYCAGLQHCLDLQEEERQKVEQALNPHQTSLTQPPVPLPSVVTTLVTTDDCDGGSGSGGDIDDEFEDIECSNDSNIVIVNSSSSSSGSNSISGISGQRSIDLDPLASAVATAAVATTNVQFTQESPSNPPTPPPLPPQLTTPQITESKSESFDS